MYYELSPPSHKATARQVLSPPSSRSAGLRRGKE